VFIDGGVDCSLPSKVPLHKPIKEIQNRKRKENRLVNVLRASQPHATSQRTNKQNVLIMSSNTIPFPTASLDSIHSMVRLRPRLRHTRIIRTRHPLGPGRKSLTLHRLLRYPLPRHKRSRPIIRDPITKLEPHFAYLQREHIRQRIDLGGEFSECGAGVPRVKVLVPQEDGEYGQLDYCQMVETGLGHGLVGWGSYVRRRVRRRRRMPLTSTLATIWEPRSWYLRASCARRSSWGRAGRPVMAGTTYSEEYVMT
jgi:hypothetical protein